MKAYLMIVVALGLILVSSLISGHPVENQQLTLVDVDGQQQNDVDSSGIREVRHFGFGGGRRFGGGGGFCCGGGGGGYGGYPGGGGGYGGYPGGGGYGGYPGGGYGGGSASASASASASSNWG